MITSWMLYAAAVSVLVTIAAVAAERALNARRGPIRFVWAAALFLSSAWPVVSVVRSLFATRAAVSVLPFTIVVQSPAVTVATPLGARLAAIAGRGIVTLWIALSIALLLRLARGVVALRRMRREWRRGRVDGVSVRLSENVGPAVVGLRMMDVVLPEWIFSLDAALRTIVLCHEDEHRRARDPYLLFGAALAVAIMPWNPLLWLQARRLRLAIELDCDARVLRVHPSPERYGMLMLTIAQRRSLSPALFAPMLTEPTTQLERRILAMRRTTRKLARVTMCAGTGVAVLILAFACSLQSGGPTETQRVHNGPNDVRKLPAMISTAPANVQRPRIPDVLQLFGPHPVPAMATPNQAYFDFQVERQAAPLPNNPAPRYPDALRNAGVEGEVVAQFVLNRDGRPDMGTFKVLRTTHDLFTQAVKTTLPNMRFKPAQVGGMPVRQLIQTSFQFNLSKDSKPPR